MNSSLNCEKCGSFLIFAVLSLAILLGAPLARADYVGELETTKYFDPDTIALIQSRLPGGLLASDEISYYIQFTPTNNGGMVGGGGFVTDYIPAGTQVVNAQFVRLNSDGSYTQIAPPGPAAVLPAYVPLYSDTGIFYSTNPKTAVYSNPVSPTITPTNGYATIGGGCGGISLPSTTHNAWDSAMVTKFQGAARNTTGTCAVPPAINYNVLGLSPVAGPDSFLTLDSTGVVGPWQRIAYPGSYKGTATGVASYGSTNKCIGGTPTSAGYNLSSSNPLPINTTAVRFAAGKVTVGELFSVRITLKLTSNMPAGGLINNTEVFGGDASLDPGSTAGKDNHWKYHCPAVAVANSNLLLVKQLVGACTGVGCVPAPITAGVVPSAINLKLRYTIQYLNLSGSAQTNVVLKDKFAIGASYVAGSAVQLSGAPIGAPTPSAAPVVLTFPTIASLASGTGGKVQYDVVFVSAPSNNVALINTANMVSTQVPAPGVSSKAIATASTKANLWISKSTSTPSVTSGSTATYTISVPNNGAASATSVVVRDYLPSAGGATVNDRFSYASLTSATITTSAGVVSNVVPTVTSGAVAAAAPYTGLNREQVTFTLPAATAIPAGGKLTITFNTTVGSNIPASATPYLNDANVGYAGGATATSLSETIGTAPVTVTAPMSLTAKVDCVYAGAVCVPYTSGTIAPLSKIKYKLSYSNISAATLSTLGLTNTLPANTSYVAGTTIRDGVAIANPGISGQVLTFATLATLNSGATGYVSFDVQLGAGVTSGTDITNTAKITASTFPAGVTASVTTSVRDQANLQITKTASPSTIQIGGSVTYTITVTNTGNAPASGIKIYDELPFVGAIADPLLRFNFVANSDTFNLTNTSGNSTLNFTGHTLATSAPPTFSGYTGQTNRQEILWTFVAVKELASGDSFTLTYTATAGANIPASATPYTSDVQAQYISATNTMYSSAASTAPVTIGGLDHIRILHNGTGLTCMPETLTVQACGDAACGTLYTASVTTAVNGVGAVTFSGGTTTVSLPVTTAGSFTLGATLTSPAPQTAARCFNGVTEICTLNFSDAGFIISTVADGAEAVIPDQVAGVSSGNFVLRAVKKATATSACTAALTGAQTINVGYECNNPTTCYASNLMSVNGGAATTITRNDNGSVSGYTPVNMTFDANGNAPFTFNYSDVGQVKLWADKTVNSATLSGNSNAFVVKPGGFVLSGVQQTAAPNLTNPAAVNAAGVKFVKAGEAFSATVTAVTSSGSTAYNYGKEAAPEGVKLTSALVTGLGLTNNPPIGGTFAAFTNGVATGTTFTWNEVGIIKLTPSVNDGNYLGAGDVSGTQSGNVGRFYAAKFALSNGAIANRTDIAGCTVAGCGSFTYMGEQMSAVFTLTAKAVDGTTTLQNYNWSATPANQFAKLNSMAAVTAGTGGPLGLGAVDSAATRTPFPPCGVIPAHPCLTPAQATAGTFASGVANVTVPFTIYRDNAIVAGPYAALDIAVAPQDSDGVTLAAYDRDTVNVVAGTANHTWVGQTQARYGRMKLSNAHGSELLPLPMTATVQYYNGTTWIISATDNETSFNSNLNTNPGGNLVAAIVSGLTGGGVAVTGPGTSAVVAGARTFRLTALGGQPGSATISLNAPSYLPSNIARATFGVYKGSNEIIYMRENY